MITKYTKSKVPHFFIYAKDKKKHEVEQKNNSLVNRLEKIIPNTPLTFKTAKLSKFDFTMLMHNKNAELDTAIIDLYTKLDLNKRFIEIEQSSHNTSGNNIFVYKDIRNQILALNNDLHNVVDVLVKYLYEYKISNYKTTLWSSFGDVIVENIKNNLRNDKNSKHKQCEVCNKRIEFYNTKKYCDQCAKEIRRQQRRIADQKYKIKNKNKR